MPSNTAHTPGTSAPSVTDSPAPWLIGLPFGSAAHVVWLYYVVKEAEDGIRAVRVALERANGERDRPAREGPLAQVEPIEVQRILHDAVGHANLVPWP
ncbi:hypothetical protein [Streptomyces sp. NPDC047070]|uniref:hypothetical protein n=1 Tax=Streptomyces sp. NPDC047070 TaxID=3154923 RepID=UPI003457392B